MKESEEKRSKCLLTNNFFLWNEFQRQLSGHWSNEFNVSCVFIYNSFVISVIGHFAMMSLLIICFECT